MTPVIEHIESDQRLMIWGISDPTLENVLLREAQNAGIEVRRRCVDAVELLAASTVSRGVPLLLHMDLPRISREVLSALSDNTAEITIIASTDHQFSLAQSWGLGQVVRLRDSHSARALNAAGLFTRVQQPIHLNDVSRTISQVQGNDISRAHVVCLWSATGSTGRSTLAIGLAEAWAREGERALLIDADTCGPSLATALGVTDDLSGIVVACRYADQNSLDRRSLSSACRELQNNLWILTGLSDPQRWPEVGAASLGSVIDRAREFFDRVVIDIAPTVPDIADTSDAQSMDPLARLRPARNAASIAVLKAADTVVVVIRPDAIGALRLVQEFGSSAKYFPKADKVFLVNRVQQKYRSSLHREFGGICAGLVGNDPMFVMIPEDPVAQTMIRTSATMAEVRANSKLFKALRKTAAQLAPKDLRRRKNHDKIADFRPLIKFFGIFGRHADTATGGNR